MDNVQKPSNSECYISSEPCRIYFKYASFFSSHVASCRAFFSILPSSRKQNKLMMSPCCSHVNIYRIWFCHSNDYTGLYLLGSKCKGEVDPVPRRLAGSGDVAPLFFKSIVGGSECWVSSSGRPSCRYTEFAMPAHDMTPCGLLIFNWRVASIIG
jgi:hypothetical protein